MGLHPEIVMRWDCLLASMNARLGALMPPGERVGQDLEALSSEWLCDLLEIERRQRERERGVSDNG
jgi:hypothetical protein